MHGKFRTAIYWPKLAQPRAALLLLRYLEYSADDPELKKEIAETRKLLAKASALPEK